MFIPIEWLELPIETSWRWTTTCKPQPPTWTRTHSRVWVLGWHSNNSRSRLCFRSVLDGCLPLTPHTVVGFRCLPKLSSCSLPSQPHKQGQPTIKIPSCSKGCNFSRRSIPCFAGLRRTSPSAPLLQSHHSFYWKILKIWQGFALFGLHVHWSWEREREREARPEPKQGTSSSHIRESNALPNSG